MKKKKERDLSIHPSIHPFLSNQYLGTFAGKEAGGGEAHVVRFLLSNRFDLDLGPEEIRTRAATHPYVVGLLEEVDGDGLGDDGVVLGWVGGWVGGLGGGGRGRLNANETWMGGWIGRRRFGWAIRRRWVSGWVGGWVGG